MAFIIFQKENREGQQFYINRNEHYQLAGWGLINRLWAKRNKPLNKGWSLSATEILSEHN